MTTKYYNCELLSDIVINASLATEGNMRTLDYIPGSNFWGIVAGQLYGNLVKEKKLDELMDIFHNGQVSFGDAHIALNRKPSYSLPFSLFQDKLKMDLFKNEVYLHHVLDQNKIRKKDKDDNFIQLKQHRSGYFTKDYTYSKSIEKKFSLKSAQDRKTRKSADEQMFGFESIRASQSFIFSIDFKEDKYIAEVEKALLGNRSVGKSKNAQYGQVKISTLATEDFFPKKTITPQDKLLVVYVSSNLCLIDEYGSNTLEPDAKRDFGIEGKILWSASQIRTYSYSPWNNFRGTSDPQRDCIAKGSIIIIKPKEKGPIDENQLKSVVGNFPSEGLGRVLYNPDFLKADESTGVWSIHLRKYNKVNTRPKDQSKIEIKSPIGIHLLNKKRQAEIDLKIGEKVLEYLEKTTHDFKKISNSQWGAIRSIAIESESMTQLQQKLFGTDRIEFIHRKTNKGLLINGVAAQRYWDKNGGKAREILWKTIESNEEIAPIFLAKFASEKAKNN